MLYAEGMYNGTAGKGVSAVADGIAYQNKDILLKILTQNYPHVSFKAYGLDFPPVKEVLPTDLPGIKVNELRTDGVFRLEDDSLLIVDYESSVSGDQLLKYGHYALRVLERYWRTEKRVYNIRIAIIYADGIESAPSSLYTDSLKIDIKQTFLHSFDGDGIAESLRLKLVTGEVPDDEDILRLIVAPLAKSALPRQELLEKCVEIAKGIADKQTQVFAIAGMLVATDKFINREYSEKIRGWLAMTKIGQLIREEIREAENKAAQKAAIKERESIKAEIAKNMLRDGKDPVEVIKYTGITDGYSEPA
jgi:hypothetical protein